MPPTIRTIDTSNSRMRLPKTKKEEGEQRGVEVCLGGHRAVCGVIPAGQQLEEDGQHLQRIDDGQQRRERADERVNSRSCGSCLREGRSDSSPIRPEGGRAGKGGRKVQVAGRTESTKARTAAPIRSSLSACVHPLALSAVFVTTSE